jgi:hypothetical protein
MCQLVNVRIQQEVVLALVTEVVVVARALLELALILAHREVQLIHQRIQGKVIILIICVCEFWLLCFL